MAGFRSLGCALTRKGLSIRALVRHGISASLLVSVLSWLIACPFLAHVLHPLSSPDAIPMGHLQLDWDSYHFHVEYKVVSSINNENLKLKSTLY